MYREQKASFFMWVSNISSNRGDVTSALDDRRGRVCLSSGCYDDNFLGSRMNGITQQEASRFKSAPEVFEMHRLPGHLQSK